MNHPDDICGFCEHPRKLHHKDCPKCFAIPSTHGHFCDSPLCCCLEFMEPDTLSDDDIAVLTGAA